MKQAGDIVFVPVTDHPEYPQTFHEGDYAICGTREECQRTCDAWNGGGADKPYPFYVREVVLQEQHDEQAGLL